jgi:PAS domain S-box-containing protein
MQLTPSPQSFIRNVPNELPQDRVLRPLRIGIVLTVVITVASLVAAVLSVVNGAYLPAVIALVAAGLAGFTAYQLYHWLPTLVTLHNTSEERSKLLEASATFATDSMDYLNTILTSMAGSVVVFGTDKNIKFVNQAILDLTGYKAAELLGQPVDMLFNPETFSSSRDILGNNGFVRHGERVYKTKSGDTIDVSFSSAVMRDQQKRVTGIVCVAQNISTLKKMESELNQRVQQLAILAQIDQELTLMLSVSRVLSIGLDISIRLSGASAGGIALKTESGLTPGLSLGYPSNASEYNYINDGVIRRVAGTLEPEFITDVELDGDYLGILPSTVSMMLLPLISQDQLIGVMYLETNHEGRFTRETFDFLRLISSRIAAAVNNAQLYDTSRRQLDELQQVYKQLSALEQLKTDMIRIAAHDLRNPLTNIAISLHVLRKSLTEVITPQQRERLTDIEIATRRMQQITSNILSLERINKAATGELQTIVHLNEIIQHAFDAHRADARRKNQRYQLLLLENDLYVQGDSAELEEAAANFISNAIKYTPENGKITVKLQAMHEMVHFEVRDNGYGIPEEQQSRLFQPFFRAASKETQEIEGTGLGLHLIKQIIERHYGSVTFESRYGEGSTFGFQLPMTEVPVDMTTFSEGDTEIPYSDRSTVANSIDVTMSGEYERYSAESSDTLDDVPQNIHRIHSSKSRRTDADGRHDQDVAAGYEG